MKNYTVEPGKLQAYVKELFQTTGLAETGAAAVAEMLVHADLRNVRSHGVLRVTPYLEKIEQGGASLTSSYLTGGFFRNRRLRPDWLCCLRVFCGDLLARDI